MGKRLHTYVRHLPSDTSNTVGHTSTTDESVRVDHNAAEMRGVVNHEAGAALIILSIQLNCITRLNICGEPVQQQCTSIQNSTDDKILERVVVDNMDTIPTHCTSH